MAIESEERRIEAAAVKTVRLIDARDRRRRGLQSHRDLLRKNRAIESQRQIAAVNSQLTGGGALGQLPVARQTRLDVTVGSSVPTPANECVMHRSIIRGKLMDLG